MFLEEFSFLFYASFFIGAIVFSFLLNGLLLNFAKTLGIRNNTEGLIRWNSQSKPALGGISFYLIFLFSIVIYSIFYANNIWANKQVLGILGACSIGFVIGLADDAYNTRPILKFLAQLSCAIILIVTGTHIQFFSIPFFDYVLTILWVVGIMNSVNMLDNMDAITASVSAVIIAGTLMLLYFTGAVAGPEIFILTGCLASLIGFLFYNWHPSRMFMGDTGSQFLGALLSAVGIIYFWNLPYTGLSNDASSKKIITTVLIFIIPIIDTTTVVINRLLKKQSPFIGGKDHTAHYLFYRGLSEKRIALLFIFISALSALLAGISINYISNWQMWHIIIFSVYVLALFSALYIPTKTVKQKKPVKDDVI